MTLSQFRKASPPTSPSRRYLAPFIAVNNAPRGDQLHKKNMRYQKNQPRRSLDTNTFKVWKFAAMFAQRKCPLSLASKRPSFKFDLWEHLLNNYWLFTESHDNLEILPKKSRFFDTSWIHANEEDKQTNKHTYTYIHRHIHIYIYIDICIYLLYIYIYIYIYIYNTRWEKIRWRKSKIRWRKPQNGLKGNLTFYLF